eukprot:scaffold136001_cov31-Tisochrysis_lutea.AAC.6
MASRAQGVQAQGFVVRLASSVRQHRASRAAEAHRCNGFQKVPSRHINRLDILPHGLHARLITHCRKLGLYA